MKFLYEYRTKANELRRGECCATSRDAAFAALKSQGIRPSRLVLAPGFLNRLAAFGKRGWALVLLSLALVAALLAMVGADRRAARTKHSALSTLPAPALSTTHSALSTTHSALSTLPAPALSTNILARELRARGLDPAAIDEYLRERNAFNESYREQIADRVRKGTLTPAAANDLLTAVGIRPL